MPTRILDLASQSDFAPITSQTRAGSSALGKDEFLKLLVAQLANQDPTNPQDSSEFVAQLAQFSALEQQQNAVGRLDTLLIGQATANQTAAATFIGKDITFQGGQVQLRQGDSPSAELTLNAPAAVLDVAIRDGSGATIRTLQLGPQAAGPITATWDGRDESGNLVPEGTYTFAPTATDGDGKAIAVAITTRGTVSGVAYQDGIPFLKLGASGASGVLVKMSDVTSINASVASPSSAMQAYSNQTSSSGSP